MSLHVTVVSASNVPNVEKFGNSDPYAIVEFQGKQVFSKWSYLTITQACRQAADFAILYHLIFYIFLFN